MIPQRTIDLINDTLKIEEVVGDFVSLKRKGANYMACCPFHNEKTPSFSVSPSKGIYKCFGCGKSGNAVGFVMEHEQCSYVDALKYIARKYHIEVEETEESAEVIAEKQKRESLLLVSDFACKFFNSQLATPEGKALGHAYLHDRRGIEDSTIEEMGLGWAPSGWDSLVQAASRAGYKVDNLVEAGLAIRKEDGKVFDKFRERVMFPIHTVSGRVCAFSGRTLRNDKEIAKYVNSSDTPIYRKSDILLGIYFAKSAIHSLDSCILVEGNVDLVTLHQLGIKNVVASCGTSLTTGQIRLIKKFTDNITIMYDGDSAGIKASLRGIDLVLSEGMNVKVVLLPDGEDPDSFARTRSLEEVQQFLRESEKDFIMYKTDLLLEEAQSDPLKKANLINDIADTVAMIPDEVKRVTYAEACAGRLGVDSGVVFRRMARTRKENSGRATVEQTPSAEPVGTQSRTVTVRTVPAAPSAMEIAERELMSFILTYGDRTFAMEDGSPARVDAFIRGVLEEDGARMGNPVFAGIYDLYFEAVDGGLDHEAVLQRLYSNPDTDIVSGAIEMTTEKYVLSVKNLKDSLTNTDTWLSVYVPKAVLCYNLARLKDEIGRRKRSLKTASADEQLSIMQEIVSLQSLCNVVKQKLGRDI